jgi:hypothetical protein
MHFRFESALSGFAEGREPLRTACAAPTSDRPYKSGGGGSGWGRRDHPGFDSAGWQARGLVSLEHGRASSKGDWVAFILATMSTNRCKPARLILGY